MLEMLVVMLGIMMTLGMKLLSYYLLLGMLVQLLMMEFFFLCCFCLE